MENAGYNHNEPDSVSFSSISVVPVSVSVPDVTLQRENNNNNPRASISRLTPTPGNQFTPKLWPQLLATLIANTGAFGMGSVIGWSSPSIPSLRDTATGEFGPLSVSDEAWIGSLPNAGALIAGFVVGALIGRIGRKWTIFVFQIPFIIGWLLIIFASNYGMIMAGRVLTGFGGGAMMLVVPLYISEVVEDKIRGTMSTLMALFFVIGILFSFVLGTFVTWKWLSIACSFIPLLTCAIVLMPDSPQSLLERGHVEDARKSLAWLHGAPAYGYGAEHDHVESEMKTLRKSVEENSQNSAKIKDLFVPSVLKPLGISMTLMALQQLGGINEIIFYAADMFEAAGSHIDPNVSSIIIGVVQVVACIMTTYLVDRIGRKPLLVISEVGMALCLVTLGVFFYLKEQNEGAVPPGLGWLPLASLVLYIVVFMLGLGTLPWVMLGELMPAHVKGLSGSMAHACNWGLAFVVTRIFGDLRLLITIQGCYWLYAGICCLGALFSLFLVPETKGKSLDQINALFK